MTITAKLLRDAAEAARIAGEDYAYRQEFEEKSDGDEEDRAAYEAEVERYSKLEADLDAAAAEIERRGASPVWAWWRR